MTKAMRKAASDEARQNPCCRSDTDDRRAADGGCYVVTVHRSRLNERGIPTARDWGLVCDAGHARAGTARPKRKIDSRLVACRS